MLLKAPSFLKKNATIDFLESNKIFYHYLWPLIKCLNCPLIKGNSRFLSMRKTNDLQRDEYLIWLLHSWQVTSNAWRLLMSSKWWNSTKRNTSLEQQLKHLKLHLYRWPSPWLLFCNRRNQLYFCAQSWFSLSWKLFYPAIFFILIHTLMLVPYYREKQLVVVNQSLHFINLTTNQEIKCWRISHINQMIGYL